MAGIGDLLSYDPKTGILRWLIKRKGVNPGDIAGSVNPRGYRKVQINGRVYLAHRLAWFLSHGEWPSNQIDHINGKKDDNRLANLRDVTGHQNCQNRKGVVGVYRRKWGWEASIMAAGTAHYLGKFKTKSEAIKARKLAENRLHGVFSGRP